MRERRCVRGTNRRRWMQKGLVGHTCALPSEGVYQISFKMIMKTAFGKGSHTAADGRKCIQIWIYIALNIQIPSIYSIVWHMAHVGHDGTQLGRGWNSSRAKQLHVQTLVVMSAVNSTSTRVCCKLLGGYPWTDGEYNWFFVHVTGTDRQSTCGGVVYVCGEQIIQIIIKVWAEQGSMAKWG